jgi:hypothetical protein
MSLLTQVTARYGATLLANLTNAENTAAASYDATRLQAACDDVEGLVRIHAGTTYDDDDDRHVVTCTTAVITILEIRLGKIKRREAMEAVVESLVALGRVTGRDKVTPTTNSGLTRSPDLEGAATSRAPDFDKDRFDGIRLDGPAASTDA